MVRSGRLLLHSMLEAPVTCPDCQTAPSRICSFHARTPNHDDQLDIELEALRAERDELQALVDRMGLVIKAAFIPFTIREAITSPEEYWVRSDQFLKALQESNAELRAALKAIWDYENAVQRDLKARDVVSDGTMHLMLKAMDLRDTALKGDVKP